MKKVILIVALLGIGFWLLQDVPPEDIAIQSEPDTAAADGFTNPQYAVTGESVEYHGEVQGYLATPEGEGPFPALVLIHEWWGLNDNIRDLAEDFAAQGYLALAVDLYEGEVATTPDEAGALSGGVRENIGSAFANLGAATAYLAQLDRVDEDRLGSVGWCFGGQWAYNMAANNIAVDASVMYYGQFSLEDDLSMMRADILGHFGKDDTVIAIDDVEQFQAKLNTLEGDHAVYIYPNAGHAFANDDREDAYNEEAAKLAWERTLDFLEQELTSDVE